MNRMNPKVDEFLSNARKWQREFKKMRMIILDSGLTEEFKWVNLVTRFRKETSF